VARTSQVPRPASAHRFTSTLRKSDNRLWGAYIQVPAQTAAALVTGASRRVVCALNGAEEHQCALIPHGKGTFVITVNKQRRESLGLAFGCEVRVTLRGDASTYGLPLPEELRELFLQDPEGARLFHGLTPGKQRTLLYIVGSPKKTDGRVQRAVAVIRHLKLRKGKIDYRQLYSSFKRRPAP
jgi:hypothetical protein